MTSNRKTKAPRPPSTPYYPQYRPAPTGPRTLAYLVGHTIHFERHIDEQTGEVLSPGGSLELTEWNWQTLSDALFSHNLQLWCDDLEEVLGDVLPYVFRQCVVPPGERQHGQQWCSVALDPDQGNAIYGITVCRGVRKRHITLAGRWIDAERWEPRHCSAEENQGWMRRIRWLCATLGTGIKGTPASVGEHVIRTHWPTDANGDIRRQSRPILPCISDLERWSIGSRMELFATPGMTLDVAYRADKNAAYPSFAGKLPSGHVGYLSGRESITARFLMPYDGSAPLLKTATWFSQAVVIIDEPGIPAGDVLPFAYKHWRPELGKWEIVWPTAVGTYGRAEDEQLWLWREQAEEIQKLAAEGLPIRIAALGEAWVWNEWGHELRAWSATMEAARRAAPGPLEEKLVKLATVAGFGRLGMQYHSRELVREQDADTHRDDLLSLQAAEVEMQQPYYIRRVDTDPGTPKHQHAYVLAMCSLAMSQAAHAMYRRGCRVLHIYVDEIEVDRYPGPDFDEREWRMGGWKLKERHCWTGYLPGHIHSLEEQRMPGVDTWYKQQLYRYGEQQGKRRRKHLNEEADAVLAAPMTRERFLEIQEKRIKPYYTQQAENLRREAEREQLRVVREYAEAQLERESWRKPKWGER